MGHATGSCTRTACVSAVAVLLALAALSACATCPRPCPSPAESFLAGWAVAVGDQVDAATGCPKRIRRTADDMVMVLIPAGTFHMGTLPGDGPWPREHVRHPVTLSRPYYMDEHEVTNEQFARFAAATGHLTVAEKTGKAGTWGAEEGPVEVTGASWRAPQPKGPRPADWARRPVVLVNWDDAVAYARWARVSLPTEAQWERAARGGLEDVSFPWGPKDDEKRRNGDKGEIHTIWDGVDSEGRHVGGIETKYLSSLLPVKQFDPNGYGLFDMVGNVEEWCADWYHPEYYAHSPAADPPGPASPWMPSKAGRVARGGSWIDQRPNVWERGRFRPSDDGTAYLGFRCARTLP